MRVYSVSTYWFVTSLVLFGSLFLAVNESCAAIIIEGDAGFNNEIFVAQNGGDGSLAITAPTVLLGGGIFIADQPGLVGSVVVDGGVYEGGGNVFAVGQQGNGTLDIKNGGRITSVTSANLEVGQSLGSLGSVRISGAGSLLDMPNGDAIIGKEGYGTFTVENGARAYHERAFVGGSEFINNPGIGTATVTGSGSRWDIERDFTIGNSGSSGELWIQSGGQVRSNLDGFGGSVVGNQNSTGLVVVEGQGSLWQDFSSDGLAIGSGGSGTVLVRAGAKVTTQRLFIGNQVSESFGNGLITIDGLGSQWTTSHLSVGGFEGTGQILLTNGAKLINNNQFGGNTILGNSTGSFGRLVVDGITTQWIDNSQEIVIGERGFGEVAILNGAAVTNDRVILGRDSFGRGEVQIDGLGSRWAVNELQVGDLGSARVEIHGGTSLSVSPFGSGFQIGSQGEVSLSGGTIFSQGLNNEGTLSGSGLILAFVSNLNGNIRVNPADRLVISSLNSVGQGRLDILGGELEVEVEFYNGVDSVVTMENATLRPTTRLDNDGTVTVAAGSNRVYGEVLNQGSIILSGNSQTTFYDDVDNNGTVNVSTGSTATFFGEVAGNGVGGGGTVFLEGDVTPGFSPGVMAFGGDVVLGDFSTLTFEIAGETSGTEYDQLQIAGEVSLGGQLVLETLAPLGDTTLTIVEAGSILGQFDETPALFSHIGAGMFLTDVTYGLGAVTISLVEGLADFNLDGSVDQFDLDVWSDGFGTSSEAELANGDANGNGRVNGADFLIWQRKFTSAPVSGVAAASEAIPEPSGLVLLLLAVSCRGMIGGRAVQRELAN